MKKLTKRQADVLNAIETYIDTNGYPPTVREIGEICGMSSSSTVHGHLNNLEKLGYINRGNSARTITLNNGPEWNDREPTIHIPVLGRVTAGNPIEAIENVSDYFPIPMSMVKSDDPLFMLTITGDSMKDAGILDGDKIVVRQTHIAYNNDIVVALTEDNEATVKRFFKEADHYRLQPENEDYEPIILKEVSVIGKVIGVYREIE